MILKTRTVQTSVLVPEKKIARTVPEREAETQTSVAHKRSVPVYLTPKPTGKETCTQVGPEELFDFDIQIKPILEVLVADTLRTAVTDLEREMELARIHAEQERYEAIKRAELMEVERLEAAERRKQEEKARRLVQERARLEISQITLLKAQCMQMAKTRFQPVCDNAISQLRSDGFFRDPQLVWLESEYLPSLILKASQSITRREKECQEVLKSLFPPVNHHTLARECVDTVIRRCLSTNTYSN